MSTFMSTFVTLRKFLDRADIDYELRKKIINCQSPEELLAITQDSNDDLSILSLQELTQTIKSLEDEVTEDAYFRKNTKMNTDCRLPSGEAMTVMTSPSEGILGLRLLSKELKEQFALLSKKLEV